LILLIGLTSRALETYNRVVLIHCFDGVCKFSVLSSWS